MHSFTLKSGAKFTIYVSPYTPAFCNCAFAYEHNEDRFDGPHQVTDGVTFITTKPIPDVVDIVMTHGPPKGILDWCPWGNVGCENLLQAIRKVRPMMHCFGHVHEGNGVEIINWKNPATDKTPLQKNEAVQGHFEEDPTENSYPQPFACKGDHGDRTHVVSAAITTGNNRPENAPWLISFDLPRFI